jgi:phosphatidylserine/phosphatidylglycerophosphate/cardiolipin synthase-like enzyme
MAKFLTTNGINYLVEEIIKGAKERVVLVSPYLQLNARIRELLSDGYRPDVDIRIIYGKKELDARERQWLNAVPHIRTSFCQNLHAKCYLNENLCVITSLNLHLFSQQNNNEMGIMIKRATDHQLFADVCAEVERLLRLSQPTHSDRENLVLQSAGGVTTAEEPAAYAKLPTGKLAAKLGVQAARLYDKLIGIGYLEVHEGKKRLTAKGKEAGGEFRFNKGPYFLWPTDLQV